MVSTVICNTITLQGTNEEHSNPTWPYLRRNSVPPTQALKAKHLLAYLPRPPQDSPSLSPYLTMVETGAVPAVTVAGSEGISSTPSRGRGCETSPLQRGCWELGPGPLSQSRTPEGAARPHLSPHRTHQLQHLSSRWGAPAIPDGDRRRSVRATSVFSIPATLSACGDHARRQRYIEALLGDGTQPFTLNGEQRQRYVTKDGKCRVNLGHIQDKARFLSDVFTTLVDLKCGWFLLVFTVCYITTWVAFAEIYLLDAWLRDDAARARDPLHRPCYENVDGFLSALLLSLESQMTIGYGHRMVTPHCVEGVVLLMAQSLLGSIIDVLMVGCMFVKISRPQKRAQTLVFSKHCVVSPRDGQLCLMFRIGDLRESHMVDAKVRAKLIQSRLTKEGEFIPLEQSEINLGIDTGGDRLFLVEPQTICHVINETSPFWTLSAESLKRDRFEILVILEGIVEASGMTCQARTSYTEDEILWGHRFESCMTREKGAFQVDYTAFDKTFAVPTCMYSAKEMAERERGARVSLSSC